MSELEAVGWVFLVWVLSAALGWVFILGAMLPPCGITFAQLKGRDKRTRNAVRLGMDSLWFWVGFWGSFATLVVNSLAPLGLIGTIPLWSLLGVMVLNVASNAVLAVPLRLWIWSIYSEKHLVER